jgi:hypothetical protein
VVRKVKDKYNFWLVGYYDDFNGARALANDDNIPDNAAVSIYSHAYTHFGNPLNGEATLNPRYRWSRYDRAAVSGYPNNAEPYMFSLATNRLLHNKGAFEWLSNDVIRNYPNEAQGRAQIQYPDGHTNTNKFRTHPFSTGGSDAYQMFSNGHDTLGRYIVPTGDIDSSFGRRDMLAFTNTYTSKTGGKNTWVKETEMSGSNFGNDDGITMVRRAHLAGKWMGETLNYTATSIPLNVFAPLESPSGMPFLCVQQYNQTGSNTTPSIPSIYYDGSLNSRDTNDILHFRLAVRSFNGDTNNNSKVTPKVTIKAGFTSGATPITQFGVTDMEAGLTGTAKISFNLDIGTTANPTYDTNPLLYEGNTNAIPYNNDDSWIDVDVHLNYDTGRFNVYQDGNLKVANQPFTGIAEDLYGWEIYMHPLNGASNVSSTLMLDRVSLCRPLTDDPAGRDLPPITDMSLETTNNGYSQFRLKLIDDYTTIKHNFTSVFLGNKLSDWGIVMFTADGETGSMDIPRIDRPVWRGLLDKINIKENKDDRTISISCTDTLTVLDKTIPMWELGQNKTNDLETFSPYWAYEAEGLIETMDLGQTTLKQFAGNVGRDFSNSYENRLDQRTQKKSGHPIQMYNNEDGYGPNNLEDDFEGAGIDYFYEDATGIRFILTGNPNLGASGNIIIDNTGIAEYDGRTVAITAHHSINTLGAIVSYDATHSKEVLTVAKGSGTGQFPFVEDNTNQIAYIGKYLGPSVKWNDPTYYFSGSFFDAPTYIQMNYMEYVNNNPATWENGRGSVGSINILDEGSNYLKANGYYTITDSGWIEKGEINLPAPLTPNLSLYPNWVGEKATGEWESNTTHIGVGPGTPDADDTSVTWATGHITTATITDGGFGYGADGMLDIAASTTTSALCAANATSLQLTSTTAFSTSGYGTINNSSTLHDFKWTGKSATHLVGVTGISATYTSGSTVFEDRVLGKEGVNFSNGGCDSLTIIGLAGDTGTSGQNNDGWADYPEQPIFLDQTNLIRNWGHDQPAHVAARWQKTHTQWDSAGSGLVIKMTITQGWESVGGSNEADNTGTIVINEIINNGNGFKDGDILIMSIKWTDNNVLINRDRWLRVKMRVNRNSSSDARFELIQKEQAHTDNLTFFMDTSTTSPESLEAGDEIIISKPTSATDIISGKHTIKAINKVLNFHNDTSNTTYTIPKKYLWQIQTYTDIPSGFTEGGFGNFNLKNGLLTSTYWGTSYSNRRLSWSNKRAGTITPKPSATMPENITSRAVHARWMRDLPDSLWFKYHYGKIGYTASRTFDLVSTVNANADKIEITQATYNAVSNAGVGEIVQVQPSINYELRKDLRDFFIYKCKYSEGGNWYLGGCKYISLTHPTTVVGWASQGSLGAQPTKINIVSHDDDWKHLWLLWADMRNDGKADADGGSRKKVFGLKYPTSDNYNFSVQFDDQVDENGNPEKFAELKVGEDLDVWELDSTLDDSTGAPFSRPLDYDNMVGITGLNVSSVGGKLSIAKTGHGLTTSDYVGLINFGDYDGTYKVATVTDANNFVVDVAYTSGISGSVTKYFYTKTKGSSIDETYYRDWQDKGGALVVVDTSKFFNLNTIANKGKVGQEGGGQTNLGDYHAVGVGDPVLIDSYYRNAASTTTTTGDNYRKHYNLEKIVSSKTDLESSIGIGQFWIEPTNISIFNNNGVGRIIGFKGEDVRSEWYYTWDGKVSSDITATSVTVATPSVGDKYWTVTKSGATFKSDGVKKGAYVVNTSKPLVAGVGLSWGVGWGQEFYYQVKEVVSETQLKIERVIYYNHSKVRSIATGETIYGFNNYGLYTKNTGFTQDEINDGFVSGNNISIPKQLFNVISDSISVGAADNTWSPAGIIEIFGERMKELVTTGDATLPHIRKGIDITQFLTTKVYNNVANEYAYRLMMKIDGKYKNSNGGTFYVNDKFRTVWSNSLLKSWYANTKLSSMFDIQNIPLSENMTTYNSNSSVDSYGGINDSNGKSIMNTIGQIKKGTGFGDDNSIFTSFSWLIGRDNRLDFRPKYNSGYNITRDEVKVSSVNMGQSERVDNVRIIYNNGMSITDYPKPAASDTTSWKVLEIPEITGNLEALAVAKAEYNSRKKNPMELKLKMMRLHTDDKDAMLDGGRYGYIADAQVALQGNNDQSLGTAWCWTIMGTGGVLFPGMVNALDGNMGATISDTTLHSRYGGSDVPTGATVTHQNNYTWYGSRSISKALQIVHIGKDTPKVSATTGEKLRLVIAVKPNQAATTTIDTTQFRVFLLDCSFTTATASGYAADLSGDIDGHSYVDIQHNGFYEVNVPTTYGTGKVVVSFNADYCRDLLRSRCGLTTATQSSGLLNVLHNSVATLGNSVGGSYPVVLDSYNYDDTIFPLGCRTYSDIRGGMGSTRHLWYAPTLHIVEDVLYVPATYVKYTDAAYDIDNKTMVITNVKWSADAARGEQVALTLREDESASAGGILSYIFQPVGSPQPTNPSNVHTVIPVKPPEGGYYNDEIKPETPTGGNNPSDNDGYKVGGSLIINDFSDGAYRTIKKAMDTGGSKYSAQYGNNILGQDIMPTTPSSMRGMAGALKIHPTQGSAIADKDGIKLPGKGKDEGIGAGVGEATAFTKKEIEHKAEARVQTPTDAITDEINITADITLPSTIKQAKGTLKIKATCLETGESIEETINVNTGSNLKNMQLCSTALLSGAGTTGNTIVVTLSRVAGQGSDNANYTSMTVKNLNINFRRAAFNSQNTNNVFMPYR